MLRHALLRGKVFELVLTDVKTWGVRLQASSEVGLSLPCLCQEASKSLSNPAYRCKPFFVCPRLGLNPIEVSEAQTF